MTAEIVVTEEEGIRIVRMNRPEKKNALTQTMYAEMTHALREAEAKDTIRCVVLSGCPGAFCAGSDISDFQRRTEGGLKPVTVDFLHALARNPKPLLAAVDGLAIGIGTTMLLHCDYVVASGAATFATRPGFRPPGYGPLDVGGGSQGRRTDQCSGRFGGFGAGCPASGARNCRAAGGRGGAGAQTRARQS